MAAKSAFRAGAYRTGYYGELGSESAARAMAPNLRAFIAERTDISHRFSTFVAFFDELATPTEEQFERQLWQQLKALHQQDTQPWDPTVSANPDDKEFGFSYGGLAFFVVGMHPASSRRARRFVRPALVFNAHLQFEQIRHQGKFAKMQQVIRDRDHDWQGSPNPMLADFGTASEARQYSGRAVPADWRCPFHPKTA